jgi:hypothetical protein
MALKTLTSANSKFTITVPALGLPPFTLQGYASDSAFATDQVDVAETQKGVDGKMSAGFVPFITPITVTLQADSDSGNFFDQWLGAQEALKELAYCDAVIDIPSIGKTFVCTKGALARAAKIPNAEKILRPVAYVIHFDVVQPVPLAVG